MSRSPESVPLWGGTLCLDYANSVDWSPEDEHVDPRHTDVFRSEEMLDRWGRRVALLSDDAAPVSPSELLRARALRDAVYRVGSSISRDQTPGRDDLDALMTDYVEAVEHAALLGDEDVYRFGWPRSDPRTIRYAVATDAIALLQTPGRLVRVSRCPGRGCGWLFLNSSGRRRWCSMSTCGSRDKMRRLYERRTQHGSPGQSPASA